MAKLNIAVSTKEVNSSKITVVDVDGIIDGSTVSQLEEEFENLKKGGDKLFLFDFSDLEYISSAGIGFFMKEFDIMKTIDGKVVLMNLSPRVTRIFELLDLLDFFLISSDENEAISKLIS